MITVVNKKAGGEGVYIGRRMGSHGVAASPLANQYRIGTDGDRAEVIEKYRRWLWRVIRERRGAAYVELLRLADLALKQDLSLCCWCAPEPCHGDVISRAIDYLNSRVFVFGSNLAGRHGKGAALHAHTYFGAVRGQGTGSQGQSYAIPTKDENLRTLPLEEIARHVSDFLAFAREHQDLRFHVTRVGCGLAGYKDPQIAPMFESAPANCDLPTEWLKLQKAVA